jgi:mannose-1-phosphate guanylyltransferase / phosphomannomutase
MIAVIMAGGKGTRLRSVANDIPKPMVSIAGKPILERQIDELKAFGISDFIIVIGYLGNVIKDYFKDGRDFGVSISYIVETEPLGSGGALFYLKGQIKEDFLLVFGDIVFSIDWSRFIFFHKEHAATISLLCHPNSHPYDSDLVMTDNQSCVIGIDSKNNVRDYFYQNIVNAGVYVLSPDIFSFFPNLEKRDFERDVLLKAIVGKSVYAYSTSEYLKDAGTPDRYEEINADIVNGIVAKKNLKYKQKCIFLDRDGTINKYVGLVKNAGQFELLPGVGEAIKRINGSEFLCIVITNQPVVARGDTTFQELQKIHNKMETLLGKEGAYLDGVYFCPHHPDKGFVGEVPELKIACECRKPKIGLLLKAQQKYNIDLQESFFIGDSNIDVETGQNAHCQESMKIPTNSSFLLPCVENILKEGHL